MATGGANASAELARAHHGVAKPLKKKKCPVEACDAEDHNNVRRWAEGHTTHAGCPKHPNVRRPK